MAKKDSIILERISNDNVDYHFMDSDGFIGIGFGLYRFSCAEIFCARNGGALVQDPILFGGWLVRDRLDGIADALLGFCERHCLRTLFGDDLGGQ